MSARMAQNDCDEEPDIHNNRSPFYDRSTEAAMDGKGPRAP